MGFHTGFASDAVLIEAEEVGTFIWDVLDDCLKGDDEIAEFFGLPNDAVAKGLGIDEYLNRIVPEDRDRVAAAVHAAIVKGGPYRTQYRVADSHGKIATLTAMGRCFFDDEGTPIQYCGVIFRSRDRDT